MIDCPAGSACVQGSVTYTLCLPGYYQKTARSSHCEICPSGFICHDVGTVDPVSCRPGTYCPEASTVMTPCKLGTYQNATGSSTCSSCPGGYACGDLEGTVTPNLCNPGTKCPAGSIQV
jgi:hypothetical protein